MLKVKGLKLSLDALAQSAGDPSALTAALSARAARLLRIRTADVLDCRVLRRSLDAREAPVWVYTAAVEVRNEAAVLRRVRDRRVSRMEPPPPYRIPEAAQPPDIPVSSPLLSHAARGGLPPPVIAGAGPAGLFAALVLASAGLRPVLLERGRPVEQRRSDVERFRSTGELNPESNVQFGEGGAGSFSDGKLNTGTRDPRHRFILEQLAASGAPEEILTDGAPHVGTDRLYVVLQALRRRLLDLGTDLRFSTRLADLDIRDGILRGITVEGPEGRSALPCRCLILCPGHSARDTFAMLHCRGVPMEQKPFAVGVRIEHRQADIDAAQYREYAGRPGLPASSYKLSCHLPNGRGVFSFCVCPGGEVVAAASERERAVTNGMSQYARDGVNINGGLLVSVAPEDFSWPGPGGGAALSAGSLPPDAIPLNGFPLDALPPKDPDSPLAGIAFQRRLEAAAYALGGGGYAAPVQRVEDFLLGRPSKGPGRVIPTYRPGISWTDLSLCLPDFITDSLRAALPILGRKLRGYDNPDAVLTAVESRSSSPVRILRDETGQSAVRGLYPCGEGAGYAGGILSAAADGMRCAERVCEDFYFIRDKS